MKCPRCGSEKIIKAGYGYFSNPPHKRQKYQCKNCGKHFYENPAEESINGNGKKNQRT